ERVDDAVVVQCLPVELRGDAVAERERVEPEAATGAERPRDALEGSPLVMPTVQVEKRPEWNVDERRGLLELEVPHVAEPELEREARRTLTRDREHRGRGVDAEDRLAGLAHNLERDAAAPHRELHDRSIRLPSKLDIVGDVLRHMRRPRVVDRRPGVIFAHAGYSLSPMSLRTHLFISPRFAAGAVAR